MPCRCSTEAGNHWRCVAVPIRWRLGEVRVIVGVKWALVEGLISVSCVIVAGGVFTVGCFIISEIFSRLIFVASISRLFNVTTSFVAILLAFMLFLVIVFGVPYQQIIFPFSLFILSISFISIILIFLISPLLLFPISLFSLSAMFISSIFIFSIFIFMLFLFIISLFLVFAFVLSITIRLFFFPSISFLLPISSLIVLISSF